MLKSDECYLTDHFLLSSDHCTIGSLKTRRKA